MQELPKLREQYTPDAIIANIDNITSGRWPVSEHAQLVSDAGVDVMTWGDHVFDNWDSITPYLNAPESNVLRPANFYQMDGQDLPWAGHILIEKWDSKLLVIHILWEVFINHRVDNPFHTVENILKQYDSSELSGIVIDFHKEATAELQAMALYFDGRVSFVWGTHTHAQTNDDIILPWGTGMITDLGMSGSLYSVIWADISSVRSRFLTGLQKWKIEQNLDKNYVVSWVFFEIDESSWQCTHVEKIRIIWKLDS